MTPFRHEFAFTGGSDEEFFWRCRRDGRSFAWADGARVLETVPHSRISVGYVLRRKFRTGTGATRIETEHHTAYLARKPAFASLYDESLVPPEFYTTPKPQLDKRAILSALKDGIDVPGVNLAYPNEQSLVIRSK